MTDMNQYEESSRNLALQAEVERLREEYREDHTNMSLLVNQQYQEVERLRKEKAEMAAQWYRRENVDIAAWKRRFEEQKEAFAAEHTEVERLRTENEVLRTESFPDLAAGELERLREESAENKRHWLEALECIGDSETESQKSPLYSVDLSLADNIARLRRIEEAAREYVYGAGRIRALRTALEEEA